MADKNDVKDAKDENVDPKHDRSDYFVSNGDEFELEKPAEKAE